MNAYICLILVGHSCSGGNISPVDPDAFCMFHVSVILKPLSHRIVRLLDRTIGCYLANVRPIGNVCYDRQQRSHTTIGISSRWYRSSYDWSYAWSREQQRLEKIVRLVVAINDRSYDLLWPPTIDRMINSVGRRMGSDLNPRHISTIYSVSEQPIGGTTGRMVA